MIRKIMLLQLLWSSTAIGIGRARNKQVVLAGKFLKNIQRKLYIMTVKSLSISSPSIV